MRRYTPLFLLIFFFLFSQEALIYASEADLQANSLCSFFSNSTSSLREDLIEQSGETEEAELEEEKKEESDKNSAELGITTLIVSVKGLNLSLQFSVTQSEPDTLIRLSCFPITQRAPPVLNI
jgi:hypothetical protein